MSEAYTFEQHVEACRSLKFTAREVYYNAHIWPEVWRRFVERTNLAEYQYRGLILPGTLQSTTAALLIGALNPERIAWLLTNETAAMPEQVLVKLEAAGHASALRCPYASWLRPAGDHADGLRMYEGLRAVLETWADVTPEQIAVDLTGGKSPMTVALAKAAYVLKLPQVYIDSDYQGTAPIEGTQRLSIPPDPFQVFGAIERARAWVLYHNHEYAEAARTFGELAERLGSAKAPAERDQASTLLARAYMHWEAFDLRAARDLLQQLGAMNIVIGEDGTRLQNQSAILEPVMQLIETSRPRRGDSLAISRYVAAQLPRLSNAHTIGNMLAMFYTNASRRVDQQRFDSAALMLYRCLELMSQQRLATYGIVTEYPRDGLRAMPGGLEAQFEQTHRRILQRGTYGLPKKITLIAGYVLLATLNDPFAAQCNIRQIEDRADARNQSILAHGFDYVEEEDYQEFKQVVDATIEQWSATSGVVWADLLQRCTFLPTHPHGIPV